MAAVTPYHDRRVAERRQLAYPASQAASADALAAEGMRVSWGGIWGGVIAALGILLLLTALGVAIGISTVDPASTDAGTLGTGAGIWAAAALLVSLFLGGMVATRIGATFDRGTGFWEGFLVWTVSVLLMGALAAGGVGMLGSGAAQMLGGAGQVLGSVVGDAQKSAPEEKSAGAGASGAQGIEKLEQKAAQMKPEATRAAWISLGALVLSLLAAVFGAMSGRRRSPEEYRE